MFFIDMHYLSQLLLSTLLSLSGASVEPAKLVPIASASIGEVYQFSVVPFEVSVRNDSDQSVTVIGINSSYNAISLKKSIAIPPHQARALALEVHLTDQAGSLHIDGQLITTPNVSTPATVWVEGFVLSVLDDSKPAIDMGVIDAGQTPVKDINLTSLEAPGLKINKISFIPPGFTAKPLADHRTLALSITSDISPGIHSDVIKVLLDSAKQTEAWIKVRADIHGDTVPSVNPVDYSVVRQGTGAEQTVRLERRSHKPLHVKSAIAENVTLMTHLHPCSTVQPWCIDLVLKLSDTQPTGQIFGTVKVAFEDDPSSLPILIRGWVLPKDGKIVDLTPKVDPNSPQKKSAPLKKPDLGVELKRLTSAPPIDVIPAGNGPLLRWSVSNESTLYGYLIYRSLNEKDGFARVNQEIIKAKNIGNGVTVPYQWRDSETEPGKTYWYIISTVYNDGHKQQLTGPQKIVAK